VAEVDHTAHTAAAEGAAEHHVEATAFGNSLLTPGFFVALAMLTVFAIMLWKRVPALIAAALDKKIAGIREQLDTASKLRDEAAALKAEYEAKAKAADEEIAVLKAAAEKQAADVVAKAKNDAAQLIARHKAVAEAKIGAAERAAVDELRAKAAGAAAAAAGQLIAEQHGADADGKLADRIIADI
jgi:F-type H+-transporting ATPase subunit b